MSRIHCTIFSNSGYSAIFKFFISNRKVTSEHSHQRKFPCNLLMLERWLYARANYGRRMAEKFRSVWGIMDYATCCWGSSQKNTFDWVPKIIWFIISNFISSKTSKTSKTLHFVYLVMKHSLLRQGWWGLFLDRMLMRNKKFVAIVTVDRTVLLKMHLAFLAATWRIFQMSIRATVQKVEWNKRGGK